MANRNLDLKNTIGKGLVDLEFIILPNGTGTPTIAEDNFKVLDATAPVTRISAGVWDIKFKDTWLAVHSYSVGVQQAAYVAATNVYLTGATTTVATTRIVRVTVDQGAAATDIAANANTKFFFKFTMRNSSAALPPGT